MTAKNEITGDLINSRASNEAYASGWDLWQENMRKKREEEAMKPNNDGKVTTCKDEIGSGSGDSPAGSTESI